MDLQAALHDLSEAMTGADRVPTPKARLWLAQSILVRRGLEALKIDLSDSPTLDIVIRAATTEPQTSARRAFAVLIIHALAVRGLVPTGSTADVCTLIESALLPALLRCDSRSADQHTKNVRRWAGFTQR